MKWTLMVPLVLWMASLAVCAGEPAAIQSAIQEDARKVDALAADPDLKLVVVAAMADSLHIHRNHLLLLRRETGQSFATLYVSELRRRGMDDAGVRQNLQSILKSVDRQAGSASAESGGEGLRPVLSVASGVDHSSAGTLVSVAPEFGFDSAHVAAVVGVPYFRASNAGLSSGGLGDVYFSGFLRGRAGGVDFGSALTIGAPTGDKNKGLGAGKVTVDATETVSRRFAFAKPWVSAGFANSVFNNVGYVRPYTTDGNAAHFGGGVDFALPRKITAGVSGFGLEPVGTQIVYSQMTMAGTPGGGGSSAPPQTGGGMGSGMGGGMTMTPGTAMPFYERAQMSVVSAGELQDYGASLWLSVPLHSGISLNTAVTRSIAFHLTTVHVGVAIDVAGILFPHKRF